MCILTRSIQAGFSKGEREFAKQLPRSLPPHPLKQQKSGKEVSLASRKQDTARLSVAGFPGRQLGIPCFLISSRQRPSAQRLAGALSGRPQGSLWVCTDPPRAPEQRTAQRTDLWVGARQAWHGLLEICGHAAVR